MIAYSLEAGPARAYLLKSYNDIDIFVEDSTCQNMYVRLINRILDGRARIHQVFPLHGRKNVIEACRIDQHYRPRKRLYIIDGDQDLILGRHAPRLLHLYRLGTYCIENLLLSEHAMITLATEINTNTTWPDMALMLSLKPLLERAVEILTPLFVVYGVVEKLQFPIETVKYPVHRLLLDPADPGSLSESLVRRRIISIIREVRSRVPAKRYRTVRDSILRRLRRGSRHNSDYISGKNYLLPLAYLQLKKVAKLNEPFERTKVRLAQYCELTIDLKLSQTVRRAAR